MVKMENSFEGLLLDAVNEGLMMLGESGKKAILFHLLNKFSLKTEDIPDKPEIFWEGLQKIFGAGAKVIEKSIIKSLYRKLRIEYEEKENYDFLAYLNDAKQMDTYGR